MSQTTVSDQFYLKRLPGEFPLWGNKIRILWQTSIKIFVSNWVKCLFNLAVCCSVNGKLSARNYCMSTKTCTLPCCDLFWYGYIKLLMDLCDLFIFISIKIDSLVLWQGCQWSGKCQGFLFLPSCWQPCMAIIWLCKCLWSDPLRYK